MFTGKVFNTKLTTPVKDIVELRVEFPVRDYFPFARYSKKRRSVLAVEFVIYAALVLKIEHDPHWSMVAGVYFATRQSVYTAVHEPVRHLR
jgi:hypothetical protein